ncbi:MFS transporter [Companilactobacillus furfuricola]|uniref:MFS transporter n=1 Tax=Companilactobacillus furfuricola TaxID=1462575 RepID=UPI000F79DFFD|nr:MFS transporter [Companilactobacillus furfuricola]
MVRITKISAATILFILSIILMLKTGFAGFISALIGNGSISGAAGIMIAITYIITAIIYILTNRTYSLVPDIINFLILIIGSVMGLMNSDFPDTSYLKIWSWVGIIIGAIVLITSIVDLIIHPIPEDDEPENQQQLNRGNYYQQSSNNEYLRNQNFNQANLNNQYNGYPQNSFDNQTQTRTNYQGSTNPYNDSSTNNGLYNGSQQNGYYPNDPNFNQYNGQYNGNQEPNNQYSDQSGQNYGSFNQGQNPYNNRFNPDRGQNLNNSSKNNLNRSPNIDPSKSRRSRH